MLFPVNITGLSFTTRTFGMALVLFDTEIAHRTRTIDIGSTDSGNFIARNRIRRKIEISHLRFDCDLSCEIQQGNANITLRLSQQQSN